MPFLFSFHAHGWNPKIPCWTLAKAPFPLRTSGHLAVNILDFNDAAAQLYVGTSAGPSSSDQRPQEDGPRPLSAEEYDEIMRVYSQDYEVPEGWCPDDWHDHQDFIELMRQEVGDLDDGVMDGDVTEDVNYTEEILLAEPRLKKRTTSKKGEAGRHVGLPRR